MRDSTACLCGRRAARGKDGLAVQFVKNQIEEIASFLGSERIKLQFCIWPIWAIGTGKVAKESVIAEMHGAIRGVVKVMGGVRLEISHFFMGKC